MPETALPRAGRAFYLRDPRKVARALLGQQLVSVIGGKRVAGLIVETEAYLGYRDKAAHTYNWRRTERTETMFAVGGTAYVYLTYGLHHLLNLVVGPVDTPQAVLIRAVAPTQGQDTMHHRRPRARRETDLCSGPGKVGAAFGLTRQHDRTDTATSPLLFVEQLRRRSYADSAIVTTSRIGVDYAGEWAAAPLRYYLRDSPHVSVRISPARQDLQAGVKLPGSS